MIFSVDKFKKICMEKKMPYYYSNTLVGLK